MLSDDPDFVEDHPNIGREIIGALSAFWMEGGGPSHSAVDTAMELAGIDALDIPASNKADRVRYALRQAGNSDNAIRLVEELLDTLRSRGFIEQNEDKTQKLRSAFERAGSTLTTDGFVDWVDRSGGSEAADHESLEDEQEAVVETVVREVVEPSRDLLVRSLRRLLLAVRPLTNRQRGRPALQLGDEYDLQDAVEFALRLMYSDVRPEERAPSNANSSSTMDFLVKDEGLAIEVKVTRPGRSERKIKEEVLVDIADYQAHASVKELVVAVYDLAATFRNPAGFEDDLSGLRDGFRVEVIVVGA